MQKTKKSVAKRFKITATGKVLHRAPGHRHLLRSKSRRKLATAGKDRALDSNAFIKHIKRALPGAF